MLKALLIACLLFALPALAAPPDNPDYCTVHASPSSHAAADVLTVTFAAPSVELVNFAHQVRPCELTDAMPRIAKRVPQPNAPRVILPHSDYRFSDHARNASGRFTNADC